MFVNVDTWSIVLLHFLKPFCSSTTLLLTSHQDASLLFITEQIFLYMADARVMPLYDIGSLGSVVLDLGIGLMIHFPHSEGTMPFSKHTLKSTCKNETDVALHKTSTGIASIPQAFPFFALSTAFLTSNIDISYLLLIADRVDLHGEERTGLQTKRYDCFDS